MATRFAGDFFGASLTEIPDESTLFKYFPGLRDTYKQTKQASDTKNEPRLTGNVRGTKAFAGFKTFEAPK
jgi:hypothetical protein